MKNENSVDISTTLSIYLIFQSDGLSMLLSSTSLVFCSCEAISVNVMEKGVKITIMHSYDVMSSLDSSIKE